MIYLCSIHDTYKSFKIVQRTEIVSQNFCDTQCMSSCRISATPSVWVVAEFLLHSLHEWLQNFCDIQCTSGRRISATHNVWVVAEFSATACKWGRWISATSSVWVVAEFLRHPMYEWTQNFCNIQWLTVCRLDELPHTYFHSWPLTQTLLRKY